MLAQFKNDALYKQVLHVFCKSGLLKSLILIKFNNLDRNLKLFWLGGYNQDVHGCTPEIIDQFTNARVSRIENLYRTFFAVIINNEIKCFALHFSKRQICNVKYMKTIKGFGIFFPNNNLLKHLDYIISKSWTGWRLSLKTTFRCRYMILNLSLVCICKSSVYNIYPAVVTWCCVPCT